MDRREVLMAGQAASLLVRADAVDDLGRTYYEVPPFPESPLKSALAKVQPHPCVECGADIRHGITRYFLRNDDAHGVEVTSAAALLAMAFEFVCGCCGDAVVRRCTH